MLNNDVIHKMNRTITKNKETNEGYQSNLTSVQDRPSLHFYVNDRKSNRQVSIGTMYPSKQQNINRQEGTNKLLSKLKFEQEKEQLIASIKILKKSAVCAIAEKYDQIEQLKQLEHTFFDQYIKLSQDHCNQVEECKTLEENEKKLLRQKDKLLQEARQRQTTIQNLIQLVENMKQYIDELEINQEHLKSDIKKLSQQIQVLRNFNQEVIIKQVYNVNVDVNENQINDQQTNLEVFDRNDNLNLTETCYPDIHSSIVQLTQHHKQQLIKLAQFYQERIRILINNSINYQLRDINDFQIQNSQKVQSTYQPELYRSKSQLQPKQQLLTISQLSNIDRNSQYSPHNLQQDLISPHLVQQRQSMSQFTKKHFINPFVKHKSTSQLDESAYHFLNRQKFSTKQTFQKDFSVQFDSPGPDSSTLLWQKTRIFASGVLSGISLSTIVALAIKIKK